MYAFRILIALTMAIIGSVIIDQIIFKEDIEQKQIFLLDAKVDAVLPAKEAELKSQITELGTLIANKEIERKATVDGLSLHPNIKNVTSQTSIVPVALTTTDSLISTTKIQKVKSNTLTVSNIQNPKFGLIQPLDLQIQNLRTQKFKKDNELLALRPKVENDIKSKVGFLDELKVMYTLISESGVALSVWILWILFLLGIELFIMISKIGEKETDYDATVLHQMALQKKKLELLANSTTS
jgi:Domain of unknown function (DUF4407)